MNILERIPANVRLCLYLAYAVAGPILIYTAAKGWTGNDEYTLYVGVGTALGLTAAANVRTRQRVTAGIKGGQPVHINTGTVVLTDQSLSASGDAPGEIPGASQVR